MKYTEKDLYKGMKLRCIDDGLYDFWKIGAIYTLEENPYGNLVIRGEGDRYDRPTYDILNYLNGETLVEMEIVEEEKEMTKYVEVTKVIDWSRDQELLEVGKVYKVEAEYEESIYVKGVSIYINENEPFYYLRDGQFKFVEQNEEEKEMTKYKYAKITKYAGFNGIDKQNGLEIGKTYKIVSYDDVFSDDCRIYLNEEHPSYFISETQYELVEKEEVPTLKANVDVKEAIQAKIEQLRTDAEIIANKRNRMELQMFNLNSKANKLEEVLETIKEFE